MPEPSFKGNSDWKIQRGTRFGTDEEGKDFIELTFRGRSDRALHFYAQYPKGADCPEPGFQHCKLLHPPNIDQDGVAYSRATLRFEGPSPLSGNAEGTDATIEFSTQEANLACPSRINKETKKAVYKYHRAVITASYIRESRPTATRFDSELNNVPDDQVKPVADVDVPNGVLHYEELKRKINKDDIGKHYEIATWSVISSYSETTPGVFEVDEEHTKFLIPLDQTVDRPPPDA
jgi:hypothetical protein